MEWDPQELLLSVAIVQLWNWVGEQKDSRRKQMVRPQDPLIAFGSAADFYRLQQISRKMRTLFSGLIDFEEIGENTDE